MRVRLQLSQKIRTDPLFGKIRRKETAHGKNRPIVGNEYGTAIRCAVFFIDVVLSHTCLCFLLSFQHRQTSGPAYSRVVFQPRHTDFDRGIIASAEQ